jgi:hypothetical protein
MEEAMKCIRRDTGPGFSDSKKIIQELGLGWFPKWFLQDLIDFLFEIIEEETFSDPTVHLKLMRIFIVGVGKN